MRALTIIPGETAGREVLWPAILLPRTLLAAVLLAGVQPVTVVSAQADQPAPTQAQQRREMDACGVLVQGASCVLFEGGGGRYVLADFGGYRVGDMIRVVGTVDPNCRSICADADGCVLGARIYDPAVFPCGTDIPSLEEDLLPSLCAAVSGALVMLPLTGLWWTRRRRGPPRNFT